MCFVKAIASLLVMLMVGLQSVQSQNWVIVKTPSVKVISETRRVGGVLGKAKKGAALWLREGTVTERFSEGIYGYIPDYYNVPEGCRFLPWNSSLRQSFRGRLWRVHTIW